MTNLVRLKKILFVLILFLSVGCLNYIQDVNLYADGSGVMRISYWMKSLGNENYVIVEKIGLFNSDSVRSAFQSPYSTIEDMEVYTDSTDSTMHAIIELSFPSIDSLNNNKSFREYNFSLKDGAAGQKIFSQFIPPIATGFGVNRSDFNIQYKYTFGGEIITHNAQDNEGRTLVWNYTLADIGSGKTILVTFKPFKLKQTPYWIYVLSGIVLLVVIIFLFRKKKD
jgi:hypothetical protein